MSSDRLGRYSLAGPENRAAVDAGLANGAWYRSPIPRKRMKELMRRSDMPAVRDTAIWVGLMVRVRGRGHRAVGQLVGGAVLPRLRRALRLGVRLALARGGPRHRVRVAAARRGRVPGRLLHDHARPDGVALEPHPPPHRHAGARPRPGDPGHAPGPARAPARQLLRALRRAGRVQGAGAARRGSPHRGGGRLRARDRAAQGLPHRAHLAGDLRRRGRRGHRVRLLATAGADRRAARLRHVHAHRLRADPARGHGRGRARPPAQHPHGEDEPRSTGSSTGT